MARHTQNEHTLRDGAVTLYVRNDVAKPIWHCRIKLADQPYIRRSLKTRNRGEAIRKAERLYDDLRFRSERGLPLLSFQFGYVLDAYLDWLKGRAELEPDADKARRLTKKLVDQHKFSRYIREYFGERPIDRITNYDIEQFKDWRRVYWTKGPGSKLEHFEYIRNGKLVRQKKPPAKVPSASTLASEDALLRAVFDRACRMGCMDMDEAYCLPFDVVRENIENLNTTKKAYRQYWHIALTLDDGGLKWNLSKVGKKIDLAPYTLTI